MTGNTGKLTGELKSGAAKVTDLVKNTAQGVVNSTSQATRSASENSDLLKAGGAGKGWGIAGAIAGGTGGAALGAGLGALAAGPKIAGAGNPRRAIVMGIGGLLGGAAGAYGGYQGGRTFGSYRLASAAKNAHRAADAGLEKELEKLKKQQQNVENLTQYISK